MSTSPKYSNILVHRVNELYHDQTSEEYHYSHPEIFNGERERWRRVAQKFFVSDKPLNILEIGSGTGFVPLTIADFLKSQDTFTCSDISANMLTTAKKNIEEKNFNCAFKYAKIEPRISFQLDFPDSSADIILMNSVLHHIQESDIFLGELNRILKKGGLLIIAHEPNRYFFQSTFLTSNYFVLNSMASPRYFVNETLKALRIKKLAGKIRRAVFGGNDNTAQSQLTNSINQTLKQEKLITKDLSTTEIERMVDIKSEEGFVPDKLLRNYKVAYLDTYDHLYWAYLRSPQNPFLKWYNSFLRNRFPSKGSTFFVVLQK